MTRVLVLDGGQRKSLAAVRALAARGDRPLVADHRNVSLSGWSRHAAGIVRLPPPESPDFNDALESATHDHRVDVVLPTDDHTMESVTGRTLIGRGALFVPSAGSFRLARDKARTMELAGRVGVRTPAWAYPQDDGEAERIIREFPLPAVIKPRESSGARGILYASDRAALERAYATVHREYPRPLIQEWIRPLLRKVHVATLSLGGELLATFTQQVLREWPVGGGVGTLWQSIYDRAAIDSTARLIKGSSWTGIALTEYLYTDQHDEPVLMEMNPRFWNTLALSTACGVNFPGLWVDAALGRPRRGPDSWPTGRLAQWLFPGDLLNFAFNPARWKQRPGYLPAPGRVHAIFDALDPLPLLAMFLIISRGALSARMWRYALRR